MVIAELYAVHFPYKSKAVRQAGVDLIVIETMTDLAEARLAVLAAKICKLPVFVTMTIDGSGKTMSGNDALCCLNVLQSIGADAFGFNCSTGPDAMIPHFKRIAPYAKIPLIAKPNAGMPRQNGGRVELPKNATSSAPVANPAPTTAEIIIKVTANMTSPTLN